MRGSAAVVEAELFPPALERAALTQQVRARHARLFEWTSFGVFVTILALLTLRHEMWSDEMQAWLIARDSPSILSLFHALRYEGHPALWYLLLYVPAHISANPAIMQVINFAIGVALAAVVLFTQRLSRPLRLLIVFSYFFFYQYGVTARSYELACLMLVGAACCLTGEKQHRKLAILLLALSVNTHAFAAPVAGVLAFWEFYLARVRGWADARRQLTNREFLAAFAILAASGAIGLATVWPAPDLGPMFAFRHTFGYNLLASASMVWLIFFPHLPSPIQVLLFPFRTSLSTTAIFSVVMLAAAASLLRSTKARVFFLTCTILEVIEIAVTVGWPEAYHLGFIFLAFVIALLFDTAEAPAAVPLLISSRLRSTLLIALLVPQLLCAVDVAALDWVRPFSDAKEVSAWLVSQRLEENPLVLERSEFTTGILGYLQRRSAYYSSCRCFASYEVRNIRRKLNRMATRADLKTARGKSTLPVILISNRKLLPNEVSSLGLKEIYAARQDAIDTDGVFFVYEQSGAPS